MTTDQQAASILERLSAFDTATIYEAAGKDGLLPVEIKPTWHGARVCGRAFTVACPAGDNLTIHRAVSLASPGDVLVVDAQGFIGGLWGEVLTVAAQSRGIAGLVIDGGVRDVEAIHRRRFPVFARGRGSRSCTKRKLGSLNIRLPMGETVVCPGDLILGDEEGVISVPLERADEVLVQCQRRTEDERRLMEELGNGKSTLALLGLDAIVKSIEEA